MERKDALRELFIDELAEVRGGRSVDDVFGKLTDIEWLNEHLELYSTMACGEEGPC
ncbi:MAG: hypothetical protein M3279_04300 [Actinomycetota bacterium]|nr:hypothetical protein [Actinomycetota bacterium]